MNFKKYLIVIGIDFSFLIFSYLFLYFIVQQVRNQAVVLQGSSIDLNSFNMTNTDFMLLGNNIEIINTAINNILLLFIFCIIGIYILFCIFQGTHWKFVLNGNLKGFKKYLVRFFLINLISYLILVVIGFCVLIFNGLFFKGLLLFDENRWFLFGLMIILILISLIIIYLSFNTYLFLDKKPLLALRFGFRKAYKNIIAFFLWLLVIISMFVISILFWQFDFSIISLVLHVFMILILYNIYCFYLRKKVLVD